MVEEVEVTVHELIASPFLGEDLVVRPGSPNGLKIPHRKYLQLGQIGAADGICPAWLVDAAARAWNIEISGRAVNHAVIIRTQSPYGYGRASYELNLGCNYDCEHCYLGLKRFDGLSWPDRERLLHIMRDAGVLWLQLTGAYDGLTRRKGEFRMFEKGLYAGHEAGLPLALSMIVTKHNAHEVDKMRAIAEHLELPFAEYVNMVPTIYGGAETCRLSRWLISGNEKCLPAATPATHSSTSIRPATQVSAKSAVILASP